VIETERALLRRGRGFGVRYGSAAPDRARLLRHCERRLLEELDSLRRPKLHSVINATGVLLHTNLGRAKLSARARAELQRVSSQAVALEIDLQSGRRGRRGDRVATLLRWLTGAEHALVVNNGAAALWLCVHALARRRRALISRGEQVAIGGSFRMPDLTRTTGARIIEVGTTNRTTLSDYADGLREGDLVLKVHPSNYRIEGFHEEVGLPELAGLCREKGAVLVFDAGSGSLYNFGQLRLEGELPVSDAIAAGADLVTFSGDKLLGGPQAGLVIGRKHLVDRLARQPMMRALRCDKLVLASLEATLLAYAETPSRGRPDLPLFDALGLSTRELRERGAQLLRRIQPHLPPGWTAQTGRSEGAVGGGSFSERSVPSQALILRGPAAEDAERLHASLRRGDPAILSRVGSGTVMLDLRSIDAGDVEPIAERLITLWSAAEAEPR
jgi:L-seryl-tRNA(Ser) seleniumtransferase